MLTPLRQQSDTLETWLSDLGFMVYHSPPHGMSPLLNTSDSVDNRSGARLKTIPGLHLVEGFRVPGFGVQGLAPSFAVSAPHS